jgi:signal transduction histidine kinase/ActR/RegA family two-component response regulator
VAQLPYLLSSLRGLRALAAVFALAVLVSIFFIDQRAREELRLATLETAMGMNWRLNDVIVESLVLRHHIDQFVLGPELDADAEASRFAALQLRYEILWSNIAVALETDLKLYEDFNAPLRSLDAYLASVEPQMFGVEIPSDDVLIALGREAQEHAMLLQTGWQDTRYFSVQMFLGREAELSAQNEKILRGGVVLVLILLLTIYLLMETYAAGRMRRTQQRLKAAAKSAAMASEAKSVFLANVSHEIRTPLNGILGMAAELQETKLDEDQRGCLRVISHAGDVLLHTLNDVLDISKVEAGQLQLESRVFDLHAMLDSAIALYRALADDKGLELLLERDAAVPRCVQGDGQRISQVLHNLIGNAIKFTDAGSVCLRVTAGGPAVYLRFAVRDTGAGIDPAVHDKIFEPFSQADGSITRTRGGTGLGLSISRGLCDAMGGYLALESRLGKGATFWFELPLPDRGAAVPEPPRAAMPAPATGAPQGVIAEASGAAPAQALQRVLVVDDNATNRILLQRFLRGRGLEIIEVCDGAEAVDAVLASRFDVVLMDVQMPVMDGIAATEMIRARESALGRPPTRIIAITANVMRHQIESYLHSGVDAVLGKPVSKAALLETLAATPRSAA